jgi:hypothetical protein
MASRARRLLADVKRLRGLPYLEQNKRPRDIDALLSRARSFCLPLGNRKKEMVAWKIVSGLRLPTASPMSG